MGFIISAEGIEADPEKCAIIRNWEKPNTVRSVQSFLGFCNFYRRFIRNYSRIAKPLHQLTRADVPFDWTENCQRAFDGLRYNLTNTPLLQHYRPNLPTKLETDASDGVIAGVLSQRHGERWHPVAYYSKSMSVPEQNYEIHDKEMLAIIRALEKWRAEPEGLQAQDQFSIFTDHRALEYFMTKKKLNARQARWAEFLSRFHFVIKYRAGKENTLADALSRPTSQAKSKDEYRMQTLLKAESLDTPIQKEYPVKVAVTDQYETAESQNVVDKVREANLTSPSLEPYREQARKKEEPWSIDSENLLLRRGRLVVPEDDPTLPTHLLHEIHRQVSSAHPGITKTRKIVGERYYWSGWRKFVERYVNNCGACGRASNPKDKKPALLQPLPIPDRPWQHISMDFRSFPKDKFGYDAALVIVDRLSKRPVSIPCHKNINAEQLARLFIEHIYRHRGPQFISAFWREFCRILGIKLKLSTAHHAQTDGQTEIANQYIVYRLRPYINHYQDNWSELLPLMDFAAAALPHESTGVPPFLVDCGYEPCTSFDWDVKDLGVNRDERMNRQRATTFAKHMESIWQLTKENLEKAQARQQKQADKHRREIDFGVGDSVWLSLKTYYKDKPSKKLDSQMAGPCKVLEQVGNAYRLELPESMRIHPIFSPDKLRRAASDPVPGQVIEPPEPIEIEGEMEWQVEEILASRTSRKTLQYQEKWVGYDEDRTWYPASNFKGSPHKIRDFHLSRPDAPGPPARLDEWISA